MKKSNIWHLLILILGLSLMGCKKILLIHYQVKKPKVENPESLQKFIKKNNFTESEHFALSFEGFKARINILSFPGIEIYTNEGEYIPYPGEETCKGGASEFIEILKTPLQFLTRDSLNLKNLIGDLRTLEGRETNSNQLVNPKTDDYVIVIYWAKFVGKTNARDIDGWKENIANNSNSTFKTIMVNCDFQEWWGKENLSKAGF